MHMTLTGVPISAERAHRIGLVTGLHEPDVLRDEAIALADQLANQPTMANRCARDAVTTSCDVDLATGIELERKPFALCHSTGIPTRKAQELLDRISTSTTPATTETRARPRRRGYPSHTRARERGQRRCAEAG